MRRFYPWKNGPSTRGPALAKTTAKLPKTGGQTFLSGGIDRQECLSSWTLQLSRHWPSQWHTFSALFLDRGTRACGNLLVNTCTSSLPKPRRSRQRKLSRTPALEKPVAHFLGPFPRQRHVCFPPNRSSLPPFRLVGKIRFGYIPPRFGAFFTLARLMNASRPTEGRILHLNLRATGP
jgi:hypothetical protein